MSAGDALFRGWTGTSPTYKELEPEISYEPVRSGELSWPNGQAVDLPVNYVRKRVTRRLVCFSAQKSQVISNLGFNNQVLTLSFLNSSGAVTTQSLGAGWRMGVLTDAPYKHGFSLLTVTYEKVVTRGLEFGLPEGMTITTDNGVASIKYLGNTLETFDTGDGVDREGIYILGHGYAYPDLSKQANVEYPYRLNADAVNGRVFAKAELYVNSTLFETVEILGSDVTTRQFPTFTIEEGLTNPLAAAGDAPSKLEANTARNTWLLENKLTEQQKQDLIDAYQEQYPNTTYTTYTFTINQETGGAVYPRYVTITNPDGTLGQTIDGYSWEAWVTRSIRRVETYNIPLPSFAPTYFFDKVGNIIRLYFAEKVWREYDVTGLVQV